MKILFLANRLPHSAVAGGHRLIYQRMRRLTERGHRVGLAAFTAESDAEHLPELRAELAEVETVPLKKQRVLVRAARDYVSGSLPAIFWKNHSYPMMRLVGDLVERTKYDMVIAEFSEMGMYLYRNPYLSATRKVVSCHRCLTTAFSKYVETPGVPLDLRIKSAAQARVLEKYEFEMYSAMDHILTLTAEDRFSLLNHAPQLPISVIPPGIDFDYLNRPAPRKTEEPVVMMIGYFADKSNHDAAMWFMEEVWPRVLGEHSNARCSFVGEGATREMKLAANKAGGVSVVEFVDDLRPYRERATIFVNPMRLGSGLRIKVLEAMATGLPVVSTSLGAAGIPAQNGVNCFIADTPELFIRSIDWLLNDAKLAADMGRRGRELVENRYNIRRTIPELEHVLSEVVSL